MERRDWEVLLTKESILKDMIQWLREKSLWEQCSKDLNIKITSGKDQKAIYANTKGK